MSMDRPNEYEQLIEDYAEGVRRQHRADAALAAAQKEEEAAREDRQALWRRVRDARNAGHIKVGIYRLQKSGDLYAEGVVISSGDYPDLFPMFR